MTPCAARRLGARALLALAVALAAVSLSGCTPETAVEPAAETTATPPPEATHAIVYIAEDWTDPPPAISRPSDRGIDWRISGIDLATGEETVLAEETSATTEPQFLPALSPDGSQVLYGVPITGLDGYPLHTLGYPRDLRLHRLDLKTGADSVACPQPVRSFGWDGSDIIATTWRDWLPVVSVNGIGYASPPHNAVLRITGSTVTTLVADGRERPSRDDRSALADQLEFLGADNGDLYFNAVSDMGGAVWFSDPPPEHIWRVGSGESSPTIALSIKSSSGWTEPGTEVVSERRISIPPANPYAPFLANGVFPTGQWLTRLRMSPMGGESEETSHAVLVRRASDMTIVRSSEVTPTTTRLRQYEPLLDPHATRWLDARRLAPPQVPEAGDWLFETDIVSLETTRLTNLSRDASATAPLGYIGSGLDVLYATEMPSIPQPPSPRRVFLWERATGESRLLVELVATHEYAFTEVELIGGAALEVAR